MSTQTEITRIQTARNTMRTKLVALGLASSTAKLDALATAVESIEDRGAVQVSVQEGSTYTIPKGYHNGNGTVSGVSGGGNYTLQAKSVTPTKAQQNVAPDSGYYGLSGVTVAAIPDNFNDTSTVTAGAADVLANKVIVNASGETVAGTMPNNGTVSKKLDVDTPSYTIPAGYHSGSGTVQITAQRKIATPSKLTQNIEPSKGSVLRMVTIEPIPDAYQDITGVTATPEKVLTGCSFVDANGETQSGAMPDNEDTSATIDGLTITSATIPAGYTSGGTVSLTNDIETALAAI